MKRNLQTWKKLAKLAKFVRKHFPKIGLILVDYVTDLYDKWGLIG